ncbi:PDZK1-interacting protein 1 [Pteropus vampyrus]|uniref:PDZK1-interacting protein 1 n=1 Tax=Pteropus vampyrus TaxID=132908 RepID=A0A6P6CTN0_PTEVA|nr:PDZK1-interacting protein 1 [Pteropus vampyrus]
MSTLSLVILGLLTAVPPASCQQGSIELGPQGCRGEEGWAGSSEHENAYENVPEEEGRMRSTPM